MRILRPGSEHSPGRVLAACLLATVLLALAAHLTLELFSVETETEALHEAGIGGLPGLFWLSTAVVWCLVIFVLAVVGRLWLTVGLVMSAALALGVAQQEKLQLRLEPLYPSDLVVATDPGFLRQMLGWGATLALVGALVAVMAAAAATGRLSERWFPRIRRRTHPRLATGLLVARLGTVVVLLAGMVHLASFNTPGNQLRAFYESSGAHWRSWHQRANYASNGFVAGMLYNTDVPGMDRPPDYSAQTMREIARRYQSAAARINERRDPDALDDVNVVLVLGETFTDPTRLETVQVAQDPIPYTRSLMRRTTSGNMLAAMFGGGTANAEFSALTGMSLALFQPQLTTPYQMLVPEYDTFPSLVGYFDSLGHETLSIHPFSSSLYRRATVYPTFGFDEIDFEEDMHHQDRLGDSEFISDDAAFREVGDHLEESEQPLFVNLVTMQNHYPTAGIYDDPIGVTGLADPEDDRNAEHYLRGLRHSDEALQRFITSLERSEEKTVVLFYGDHLPPFWPPDVREANGIRAIRETPFFVYANFGSQQPQRLPTTSPSYFGTYLLDAADAPLPPYLVLLRKLNARLPAMEHVLWIGPDDRPVRREAISPTTRQLLHDYRLVQYDLSIGARFVQSEMFYPEQTSLRAAD